MLMRIGTPALCLVVGAIALAADGTAAFTASPVGAAGRRQCRDGRGRALMSSFSGGEESGQSPAQKKQERIMEMSSIAGAKEIAKLDLQERTKRAMLAEAVEDRIFEIVDELEQLVGKSGGLENLTDDIKEEAVELAQQTKALQVQYDDLVNGRPSPLLDLEGSD